jgi:hypothetical protein
MTWTVGVAAVVVAVVAVTRAVSDAKSRRRRSDMER